MSGQPLEVKSRSEFLSQALVALACAFLLVVSVLPREAWILDDALIYQNYVRSALQGRGLVYGPGLIAEGYSSPLWTVLLTALGAVGLQGFSAAKIVGTAVGAAAAAALGFYASLRLGWKRGLMISFVLVLSPAWAWWSASGMETPLFGLLLTLVAICCLGRREIMAAALTGLIGITRPESFIYVATILGYFAVVSAKERWPTRRTVALATICLLPMLAWSVYRFVEYDSFVANSAWAKLGAGAMDVRRPAFRGVSYLLESFLRLPGAWLLGLASTAAALAGGVRAPSRVLIAALIYLLVLFSLVVGGDWMPWVRFLVPAIPLMLLLGVTAWEEFAPEASQLFGVVVGVALLFTVAQQCLEFSGYFTLHEVSGHNLQPKWPALRRPLIDPVKADSGAHFYAAEIARFTEPGDTVVHADIGQSGYLASDVRIMDTFGLVSRFETEYLHAKRSDAELKRHFVELNPSLVFFLIDHRTGDAAMRVMKPLTEILTLQYEAVSKIRWWDGHMMQVMVRKDRLAATPDRRRIDRWVKESPGLAFDLYRLSPDDDTRRVRVE